MNSVKKILLIEDDNRLRQVLHQELAERGFNVESFASLPAIESLKEFDGVLLDMRIDQENGLQFIPELKKKFPDLRVIMMSGYGSVASAVKAMQLGAENFLTKPVTPDMIARAFLNEEKENNSTQKTAEISLARMEREYIDYVLQNSDGNITRAAKKLGLHRQSLQRKLRKNIPQT